MTLQEKLRKWRALQRALPFLRLEGLRLTYRGHYVLGYVPNLFYGGRLRYGPFPVGGPCEVGSLQVPGTNLYLDFEDDQTSKEDARSRRFWQRLRQVVADVQRLAAARWWHPLHLRMWVGATAWLRGWQLPPWIQAVDAFLWKHCHV